MGVVGCRFQYKDDILDCIVGTLDNVRENSFRIVCMAIAFYIFINYNIGESLK